MNNARTKMTFRFGKADERNRSFISPANTLSTENQNLGAYPTEQQISSSKMNPSDRALDVSEYAESIMKFPPNGYVLTSAVEDIAGGSLGDHQGELMWHGVPKHSWKPSIWRVVASVLGALATGTLFGFLVLSFLQGEISMPHADVTISTSARDQRVKSRGATAHVVSQNKENIKDFESKSNVVGGNAVTTAAGLYVTEVNIPEKVFYMLQYGVFAQADGARKAALKLRRLGMAAVEENLDQHRVYAAIASSKEDAVGLSLLLKNKQVDSYVRILRRPTVTKLAFRGDAAAIEQLIRQSDKVNEWLMSQSISYLEKKEVVAFSSDLMKQLRQEHSKWTQKMEVVGKTIDKPSKILRTELIQGMNAAIHSLNEYNKQPSFLHLWNIQQAVMIYQAAEREWLGTMQI